MPSWNKEKSILLIGLGFYNYESKIKQCMEKKGYVVDLVYDTPRNDTALQRIVSKRTRDRILRRHQKNILDRFCICKYSYIIVIVGRFIAPSFLEEIRNKKGNDTKLILYLWDDVKRVENFEDIKKYYDVIYSFDPVDCQKRGFSFLPLFYTDEFRKSKGKKDIDIYSAQFDHSDRLSIIKSLIRQNDDRKLFFVVTQGKVGYLRNFLKHESFDGQIKYKNVPISKKENISYMNRTKSILDIQMPTQVGLTIRTIEALACGVKLITTNKSIKNYDFYDNENFFIINRENPVLDWNFLNVPYRKISNKIYEEYSLDTWIDNLLGIKKSTYLKNENEYGI